jgi:hypothetical protein
MTLLASVTETQRTVFEFARVPPAWGQVAGVAVLVALCYVVVALYQRERRTGAGPVLRIGLAGLRCIVLLALAVIWLAPVNATYVVRSIPGQVAVLLDASASMSVRDDLGAAPADDSNESASRFERVRARLLADDSQWLRRLAVRNELSVYAFGDDVQRLLHAADAQSLAAQLDPLRAVLPVRPQTDIAQAVTAALEELAGSPIAGLVLISDGAANRSAAAAEIAAYARRFRAPVYTVGVGHLREPPNVRVTSIAAPAAVPVQDPFEVRIELAAAGIARTEVQVELTAEPLDGGDERRIAIRSVPLGESETATLLINVDPPPPGEYMLHARAAPLPGEVITGDNARETNVLVVAQRLRVLLVAGGPTFEYRFATALLLRDQSIDLACWLQSADPAAVRDGNTVLEHLPREPEELYDYDVVLLLDPDPTDLDARWAATVRRWVEELGGGVLLQAGPHWTSRFLRDARLSDLVAILPVTPDPDADMRLSAQGTFRHRAGAVQLAAATHPLVSLHGDPTTNREVWRALPGAWWHLPVLRAKPVATVLLELADAAYANQYGPGVLMATQPVGAGHATFLGCDSTWRWRGSAEAYYNSFWVRLVRYLAQARQQGGSKRGRIVLDRESFSVGDYVRIEAQLLDEAYRPAATAEVAGTLLSEEGTPQECALQASADRPGWYAGRVLLDRAGAVELRLPLPSGTAGADAAFLTRRLRVQRPDLEMRALRLREDFLSALADQTGGEYCRLDELDRLPDIIPKATERRPPQRAAVQPVWDSFWVVGVLAALLAIEWTLRRRSHLL